MPIKITLSEVDKSLLLTQLLSQKKPNGKPKYKVININEWVESMEAVINKSHVLQNMWRAARLAAFVNGNHEEQFLFLEALEDEHLDDWADLHLSIKEEYAYSMSIRSLRKKLINP